jgi:hypothetical protein
VCGCRVVDSDSNYDNYGVLDCRDECSKIGDKTIPGLCDCGEVETDSDSNEVPDCDDESPLRPCSYFLG